MRVLVRDGLPMAPMATTLRPPERTMTLVVKTSLELVHDGVARPVEEVSQLSGDQPYEDDESGFGAPRYEADAAPFKPSADVVVVGSFHAPRGRKLARGHVEVEVGKRRAEIDVIGRREWKLGLLRQDVSEPEPFRTLPLRYEYAFGGPDCPANPSGRGHVTKQLKKNGEGPFELPRLEWPDRPVKSPTDLIEPAGLAPLSRQWAHRQGLLGTFDERWQAKRWPWYPEDFDPAHFNCASPALLRKGYLEGDETLFLKHMHPELAEFETRLPGLGAIAAVRRGADRRLDVVPMRLDTLWIDMDNGRAELLWRGVTETVDDEFSDLDYVWADLVEGGKSEHEVRGLAEAAIAADIEAWDIEAEAEAEPEPEPIEAAAEPEEAVDPEEAKLEADLEAAAARGQAATEAATGAVEVPAPLAEKIAAASTPAAIAAATQKYLGESAPPADDEEADETAWTRERVRQHLADGGSLAGEDLRGVDLSGESLAGLDLSGTLLDGARLVESELSGATCVATSFVGADLSRAVLTEADLTEGVLSEATCVGAIASRCKLTTAELSGSDWSEAKLDGAELSGAGASEARFVEADLKGAILAGASFDGADLSRAKMRRVQAAECDFEGATLDDAVLDKADLSESELSGAKLARVRFAEADLSDATLEGVHAGEADFSGATIVGMRAGEGARFGGARFDRVEGKEAIFTGAELLGASFSGARIPGADFSDARLGDAQLGGCDLREARFDRADLSGCELKRSNCLGASFERAVLDEVDGSGSSFYAAEFLDASVRRFKGRGRDLTATKLAASDGE